MKKVIAFFLMAMLVCGLTGCKPGGVSSDASSSEGTDVSSTDASMEEAQYHPDPIWGDNLNGRNVYATEEVKNGVLGDKVTLNSLIDGPIRDERWFVWAWDASMNDMDAEHTNVINVEDGKAYNIWMYVQNDNPEAVSTGTRAAISLPMESEEKACQISGFIHSDNAITTKLWSTVVLVGEQNFTVDYVFGSAAIINAAHPDCLALDDAIVTKAASERGVAIGYEEMNGELPGGSEYGAYIAIQVEVHYVEPAVMEVKCGARTTGTDEWLTTIENAKAGDEVEFRVEFKNAGDNTVRDVAAMIALSEELEFVPGSATLRNGNYPDGTPLDDEVFQSGVNIGSYDAGINAIIDLRVRVTENFTSDTAAAVWATFVCKDSSEQSFVSIVE